MKPAPASLGDFSPDAGLCTDALLARSFPVLRKEKYEHLRMEGARNTSTDVPKAAWLLRDPSF